MPTGPMFWSCYGGCVRESLRNLYTKTARNNMVLIVLYWEETKATARIDVGRSHNLHHNHEKCPQ